LEQWQAITSHNIAASSVPGYKGRQMTFDAVQAGVLGVSDRGKAVASPAWMTHASEAVNHQNGQVNQTGVTTHVALLSDGFFRIQGDGGRVYLSRDGEFHLDASNQLVNKMGHPVLGKTGPLKVIPQYGEISVSRTGSIRQGVNPVGNFDLVEVTNKSALIPVQGGFSIDDPEGKITRPKVDADLLQGHLEQSNVSALKEMVNLISISRAYEVNHKVIQSLDDSMGKTIEVMGSAG
jgi:flagellar basal body rod protein FlgG